MVTASFVTDLVEIATQAIEAAAGLGSAYESYQLLDVAEDYYDLYKDQRNFYYDVFQNGVENPLAWEIYNDPLPILDYVGNINAMNNAETGPLGGEAGNAIGWWQRHAAAYNSPIDGRLLAEFNVAKQTVVSDWTNYLFRFAEMYYDVQNDIRWKKRMELHNIGIKEGTAVTSALNSSLAGYQDQIQDFGNMLATYGNGIAAAVGYKKGLADTADDFARVAYSPKTDTPEYRYF